MAITLADFNKIWASTSPLTPYAFSENNYKEGWNFIGATPPSRQMWDFLQKNNDEKMQYLANNYLPLSGGTMTGILTLSDGGIALSDATVGNIVVDSLASSVTYSSVEKTILTITLSKGIWVVTGHAKFTGSVASKVYGIALSDVGDSVNSAIDGSMLIHASISSSNLALDVTRIVNMANDGMYYLNAYANDSYTVANADIKAVRII